MVPDPKNNPPPDPFGLMRSTEPNPEATWRDILAEALHSTPEGRGLTWRRWVSQEDQKRVDFICNAYLQAHTYSEYCDLSGQAHGMESAFLYDLMEVIYAHGYDEGRRRR